MKFDPELETTFDKFWMVTKRCHAMCLKQNNILIILSILITKEIKKIIVLQY